MSDEQAGGRSGTGSLEDVRDVDLPEKSTAEIYLDQFKERWKTIGVTVVMFVTTAALYVIDQSPWTITELGVQVPWSKDTVVFAFFTIVLAIYTLVTFRNDIQME